MFRLTFAQMRKSVGRLVAAGIAIAIGTAFVAATLLAGNLMTTTTTDSVAASLADADVFVDASAIGQMPLDKIVDFTSVPGVETSSPFTQTYLTVRKDERSLGIMGTPVALTPELNVQVVTAGRLPTASAEVALPTNLATRLDVAIGGTIEIETMLPVEGDASRRLRVPVTVVGLVDDPHSAFIATDGALVALASDLLTWDDYSGMSQALLVTAAGTDPESVLADVRKAATAALVAGGTDEASAGSVVVQTKQQYADARIAQMSGDTNTVMYVVLAFGALALIVAGLVIANTFQVLVAQRTRTLALLRCVGATKKQLRGSVILEATTLGTLASLAGILLGSAGVQALLAVLRTRDFAVALPTTITITPAVILVPLIAGIAVTTLSAFAPARAATRVAPLAALRPADAPSIRQGSTGRLVTSIVATVLGVLLLGGGVAAGIVLERPEIGLLLGIPGGAISFVGLIVGSVFWIPAVASAVGRLLSRTGAAARLASANTLRNPHRTAATSTALLIGVTLVAMMSTGAASARATFNAQLDSNFAVDAIIESGQQTPGESPFTDTVQQEIAAVAGVAAVAPVSSTNVANIALTTPSGVVDLPEATVQGVEPARARDVLHDVRLVDGIGDGVLVVTSQDAVVATATAASLTLNDGSKIDLAVDVVTQGLGAPTVTMATLATFAPDAPVSTLFVKLDSSEPVATIDAMKDVVDDLGVWVTGLAAERAMFEQVINILLAVVVGLLAVAVVIALIGVTNTLSLSVIERQRENAMLRAIGLSKRQLRSMLAIEGLLIAVVGTLLGIVLGLVYGWSGAAAILGSFGDLQLAIPWRDIAIVLVVSVVAGLLASVIPARRAVRTSPVEALAVD
ncbi:ABC transporter permease [Sanguibacter sp. A247]|uniref:ABC transporter permease n=1 Tax=unclassified Sanguibacter TaxID=2645534 RepID=UPI003FD747C4